MRRRRAQKRRERVPRGGWACTASMHPPSQDTALTLLVFFMTDLEHRRPTATSMLHRPPGDRPSGPERAAGPTLHRMGTRRRASGAAIMSPTGGNHALPGFDEDGHHLLLA